MNINSAAFGNYQTPNYKNRSNVNFGALRRIEYHGRKIEKIEHEDQGQYVRNLMNAEWKDELGEKYDYAVNFTYYYDGWKTYNYYMELKPYHDEKSKQPPLPTEIRVNGSTSKDEFINNIGNVDLKEKVYKKIEEHNAIKTEQEKARTEEERMKDWLNEVNNS